jgi:uncharacterized membrane protein YraQ (UPF0718 family)
MRETAIGFLAILVLLVLLALRKGTETFSLGLSTSFQQLIRFLPVLVLAMLVIGFTEVLLPKGLVESWLSESSGWRGIGLAWLAGIFTPGGSMVGLPMIAMLFKAGVGTSILVTYATSFATLSLVKVPLEIGFYGWRLTVVRLVASLLLPLIAGGLTQFILPYWKNFQPI